jgi:hypothetical protein
MLPSKAYDDFSLVNAYIRTADSPISVYIQHPIPIPAPGPKDEAQLKPLKLTTKVILFHECRMTANIECRSKRRCESSDVRLNCKTNEITSGWACYLLIPPKVHHLSVISVLCPILISSIHFFASSTR